MNTQEVANRLVELCRMGEYMQAVNELYDQNVVSKEMPSWPNPIISGKDAVIKKNEEWGETLVEFHGSKISDPIVADNHFSCTMEMDCTFKEQGRIQMEEVCVYQVNNGKIVEEQFFYAEDPTE